MGPIGHLTIPLSSVMSRAKYPHAVRLDSDDSGGAFADCRDGTWLVKAVPVIRHPESFVVVAKITPQTAG